MRIVVLLLAYICTALYFSHGIKPFVSCMKNWIDTICKPEDDVDFMLDMMEDVQNAYCDGSSADPQWILSK